MYEQTQILTDPQAVEVEESELRIRRIALQLDTPTEAGDGEIHLLTNLPPKVSAKRVAETYRLRWTIEGAFQTLKIHSVLEAGAGRVVKMATVRAGIGSRLKPSGECRFKTLGP